MEELATVGKIMVDICDNEEQANKFIDALLIVIDGTFRQTTLALEESMAVMSNDIKKGNNREEWIMAFKESKKRDTQ